MSNDKVAATFHPEKRRALRWTIGLDVPWATEVVSMNARSHWTNTHRQIPGSTRIKGAYTARATRPGLLHAFNEPTCIVYLRFPDRRRRDLQNYHKTLKALIDRFVDAGVLPDDDATHLVGFGRAHVD